MPDEDADGAADADDASDAAPEDTITDVLLEAEEPALTGEEEEEEPLTPALLPEPMTEVEPPPSGSSLVPVVTQPTTTHDRATATSACFKCPPLQCQ